MESVDKTIEALCGWIQTELTQDYTVEKDVLTEMVRALAELVTARGKENGTYVSERIVNLKELEKEINNSYLGSQRLNQLLSDENPDYELIHELADALNEGLYQINDFEIEIERRKTTSC